MEISDEYAKTFLQTLGYDVTKIPESDKKEADFLVKLTDCEDTSIIEAKLKTDKKEILHKRRNKLLNGKAHILEASLGNDNNIVKISSTANKQLMSSAKTNSHVYKILLFIADGINPDTKYEQIIDTIYGRTRILKLSDTSITPCYYYRDSIFYSRKRIDAIIVISNSNINTPYFSICLNNYSSKYQKLKQSCFLKPFSNGIIDPIEEEKNNLAFIPNGNINRNINKLEAMLPSMYNPILAHIQKKYSTGLIHSIDWNNPTIEVPY